MRVKDAGVLRTEGGSDLPLDVMDLMARLYQSCLEPLKLGGNFSFRNCAARESLLLNLSEDKDTAAANAR